MRDEATDDRSSTDPLFEAFGEPFAADDVQRTLERLLGEADDIADRLAVRPPEIAARERDLDELEDLRLALIERTEAANERFGVAERLAEQSRTRLAEIARAHAQAEATLLAADERAAAVLADAESRAAALTAHAEREAVSRVRRAEREAAERLLQAEGEAQKVMADATAVQREAEARAAETIRTAGLRVEEMIDEATRARHGEIDRLHAREREVEDRIRELLADTTDLASLRVEPPRTPVPNRGTTGGAGVADPVLEREVETRWARASGHEAAPRDESVEPTIDLTDVSDAISDAIDEWVRRGRAG